MNWPCLPPRSLRFGRSLPFMCVSPSCSGLGLDTIDHTHSPKPGREPSVAMLHKCKRSNLKTRPSASNCSKGYISCQSMGSGPSFDVIFIWGGEKGLVWAFDSRYYLGLRHPAHCLWMCSEEKDAPTQLSWYRLCIHITKHVLPVRNQYLMSPKHYAIS